MVQALLWASLNDRKVRLPGWFHHARVQVPDAQTALVTKGIPLNPWIIGLSIVTTQERQRGKEQKKFVFSGSNPEDDNLHAVWVFKGDEAAFLNVLGLKTSKVLGQESPVLILNPGLF